jgi:hypothetical protein
MVCDDKWHSVVRVLFFILDEVFLLSIPLALLNVSTGQQFKNIQNCAQSSPNHPSWLSGNPKVWKISWWERTSPLICLEWSVSKMWFETMYNVQKHPMHTQITLEEETNKNRSQERILLVFIDSILRFLIQKLSLSCLLLSSHLGLWSIMVTFSLPKESWWPVDFSSTHTGEKFIIYCYANSKTVNIIYLLKCAMCGLQYIGETEQQLSKRFVSNSTVKILLKTVWYPNSLKKNGPPQCGIYTLGQ